MVVQRLTEAEFHADQPDLESVRALMSEFDPPVFGA